MKVGPEILPCVATRGGVLFPQALYHQCDEVPYGTAPKRGLSFCQRLHHQNDSHNSTLNPSKARFSVANSETQFRRFNGEESFSYDFMSFDSFYNLLEIGARPFQCFLNQYRYHR